MTDAQQKPWTFITSHARVLAVIAQNPDIRTRDIARLTGITERSSQRIVADLEDAGYLSHHRIGRRNHYHVVLDLHLRHPLERDVEVGALIAALTKNE